MVIQQQYPHGHGRTISPSFISLQGDEFPVQHLTPETEKECFGRNGSDGLRLCSTWGRDTSGASKWKAQIRASKDPDLISRTPLVPRNPHFPVLNSNRDGKTMSWNCPHFPLWTVERYGGILLEQDSRPKASLWLCLMSETRIHTSTLFLPAAQKEILALTCSTSFLLWQESKTPWKASRSRLWSQVGSRSWLSISQLLVPGYDLLLSK